MGAPAVAHRGPEGWYERVLKLMHLWMVNRRWSKIIKPSLFRSVVVGRSNRGTDRDVGALV
ncbi:BZ3500_MvSof-1268-A1-R1_Chr3-1g06049 [Microbotryum saponariae]|uniref:BZ3500_MvSof-1268-A1-R1_Chr3-1g06049 protein n=1 Tax=Microbotryum saponariae TaxID=289078 RepID=A0A2X0LAG2_9BASI|nr:BZ3500_MvSof-1268-A1-R1_Chr3-1g06049 [Microbotryum saponariae]SDA03864.1 BZ3501_MvSof-1269-A2-R1_Chr3-2g05734 [Microbotryum saponariae]